jgi:hypothetical protein
MKTAVLFLLECRIRPALNGVGGANGSRVRFETSLSGAVFRGLRSVG